MTADTLNFVMTTTPAPRKRKPKIKVDIEAKRRAGLKGGPATKRKMLKKDPSYYSRISKMRTTFAGGRRKKPAKRPRKCECGGKLTYTKGSGDMVFVACERCTK